MDDLKSRLATLLSKSKWTEKEKQWLLTYLEESGDNELQEIMIKRFDEEDDQFAFDPELSAVMRREIRRSLGFGRSRARVVNIWLKRIAVAASVIVLSVLAWQFFQRDNDFVKPVKEKVKELSFLSLTLKRETNNTNKEKSIQLPDGSTVLLAGNSEISFMYPFIEKRDITLVGNALFKIAKDDSKPFTVISNEISTTALGTEFTVLTQKIQGQVIVRLYEGKVVIKATGNAKKKLKEDVYLLPGQVFVYNSLRDAKIKSFKFTREDDVAGRLKEETQPDNPDIPKNEKGSWYMFNNQPLAQVLDDLAGLYELKIVYNKKDLENIYLIGQYRKSESLDSILKRICKINNLSFVRKDSVITISK